MDMVKGVLRLGKKVVGLVSKGGRLGAKALGTVQNIGSKTAHYGGKALGVLQAFAPDSKITKMGGKALGVVERGTALAGEGKGLIEKGQSLGRAGQEALRTRDIAGAKEVLRGSRALIGEAKGTGSRARQILRDNSER